MKKFLVAAVGMMAVGLSAPASAADLAARPYTKAPPPIVAPIYDWTGFYIGGNGGWAQNHNCVDFLDAAGVAFASGCPENGSLNDCTSAPMRPCEVFIALQWIGTNSVPRCWRSLTTTFRMHWP